MIKSGMLLIEILFPLKLKPLLYLCPLALEKVISTGTIVSAPLRGTIRFGIVYSINSKEQSEDYLLQLKSVTLRKVFTEEHIKLLNWVSDYYMSEPGLVLKGMLPKSFFDEKSPLGLKINRKHYSHETFEAITIPEHELTGVLNKVTKREFTPLLLHSPSIKYEITYIMEILKKTDRAIVLCPEKIDVHYFYSFVKKHIKREACIIHGDLSSKRRIDTYKALMENRYSIVIGTLSAIMAPVKSVSFIAVMQEHSPCYKNGREPFYNARDIAVKRGFIEKCTVLLSSITPSGASYYNVLTKKYHLIGHIYNKKPLSMQLISREKGNTSISGRILKAITESVRRSEKTLMLVNRKGYSLMKCDDCENIEECPHCLSPVMYYKDKTVRCSRCDYKKVAKDNCPVCSGVNVNFFTVGTERAEEIVNLTTKTATVRLDSDTLSSRKELKNLEKVMEKSSILIATSLIEKAFLFKGRFYMLAIINPDIYLVLPDYLSMERFFQEVRALTEMVRDGGKVYIQTNYVRNEIYGYLRRVDYYGFIMEELKKRKELLYPPYTKMAEVTIYYNSDIMISQMPQVSSQVHLIGPVQSARRQKDFRKSVRFILKSKSSSELRDSIQQIRKKFDSKEVKTEVDIDPIFF